MSPRRWLKIVVFNLATRDRLRTALLREMENMPLILAPPCGVPAFKHRERQWTADTKPSACSMR